MDTKKSIHAIDLLVITILATFYGGLLFYYRSIQQVADSLGIAYDIAQGSDMTNPHHLLYVPIVYSLQHVVGLVHHFDAISIAQMHNIAWAMLAIAAIYTLVKQSTENIRMTMSAALLQMFSLLFWQFSTQAEVYVPAIACLLLISAYLATDRSRIMQWKSIVPVVALWVLAICYHQMAVLYAVPLAWIYFRYGSIKGLKHYLVMTSMAGAITLAAYIAVYMHRTDAFSVTGFMQYCVLYAYNNPDWGTFDHFGKLSELQRIVWNMAISYLPHHVVDQLPMPYTTAAVILFFVVQLVLWIKTKDRSALRGSMLLWLFTCFLFLVWWTPGFEFFVMLSPAITILLILTLHDMASMVGLSTSKLPSLVTVLVIAILFNLNIKTIAYTHTHADIGHQKADHIAQHVDEDVLVIANFNVQLNLLYYHNISNTLESDGVFISSYHQADSLETWQELHNAQKLLFEVWYLNPWYQPLSDNGWSRTQAWLHTFNALLNVQITDDGQINTRCIKTIPGVDNEKPFYYLDDDVCSFSSYQHLFQHLDSLMTEINEPKEAVFKDWYSKHEDLFDNFETKPLIDETSQ